MAWKENDTEDEQQPSNIPYFLHCRSLVPIWFCPMDFFCCRSFFHPMLFDWRNQILPLTYCQVLHLWCHGLPTAYISKNEKLYIHTENDQVRKPYKSISIRYHYEYWKNIIKKIIVWSDNEYIDLFITMYLVILSGRD